MKSWPERFEKLRTMTTCGEITVPYFEALLHFKNTLQEMTFNIGNYSKTIAYNCAEKLSHFKKLASFKMKGWWEHLQDVERVLKYCHCIQEQSLSIYGEFEDVLEPSAVRDWTDSSVEKQDHFETLCIQNSCPANYLRYLFYKYPNIETIEVDAELGDEFTEVNMNRIASLIKDVPNRQIVFTVVVDLDLRETVQSLQAYGYDVMFDRRHGNQGFGLLLAPMMV